MSEFGLRRGRWSAAIVLVFAIGLAACGNTPSAQKKPSPGPSASDSTPGANPSDGTSPAASPGAPGSTPGASVGPTARPSVAAPNVPTGSPKTTTGGWTYYPANVYSGSANTVGITSSSITICMHAALSLGPAFNETANDLSVYWTKVNANGGVIGRKVNFSIQDDAYTPQGAQQAFSQCQGQNPFIMLGGIGFDQDPVVRDLAEQNKIPYIYTEADDGTQGAGGAPKKYTYSYTGAPSIEQVGGWMGQVAIKYGKGPFGSVYVSSANWVGGYKTFKAYMDSHGGSSVDNNSYTMNAGGDVSQFGAYIAQLQAANVQTVYLWMNALGANAFIQQAHNQGYYPFYVTPDGFNLVTDTTGSSIDDGSDADNPGHPALAGWITPAFDSKNTNVPWGGEMKTMMDAYGKYDSGKQPSDIDWMAWLAFKNITDMLEICGKNCTRNDILGIFQSGFKGATAPLCETDFSSNHNFGGQYMNLYKAHRVPYTSATSQSGSHTVWEQIQTCKNKFN